MRDLKNAGDRFFLAYIQAATFEQLERTVKADAALAAKLIPSPEYNQLRNIKALDNAADLNPAPYGHDRGSKIVAG